MKMKLATMRIENKRDVSNSSRVPHQTKTEMDTRREF